MIASTKHNIALLLAIVAACASAISIRGQQKGQLNWQGLIGKENEFIFVIPLGYQISDDGSYFVGNRDESLEIKNSRNIARCVNGTVLMVDVLEGRGADLHRSYSRRFVDPAITEITAGDFTIKSYLRKTPEFTVEQQHIYNKKSLYVVTAAYRKERPDFVETFFKSVRLVNNGAVVYPARMKDSNAGYTLTPIDLDPVSSVIDDSPEMKPVIFYRPRPSYRREFMKNNSGTVSVKALLTASGSVEKIEMISTPNLTMLEGVRRSAEHLIFLPAIKGGKPVTTWHKFDFAFQMTLVPF